MTEVFRSARWREVKLGDYISHVKGNAFKSMDFEQTGHPIVRVSNFTDRSINMQGCNFIHFSRVREYQQYKLRTNDIVITTVGSGPNNPNSLVGKVIKVPPEADDALLNQNAVILRTNEEVNQIFLFYRLKTKDFQNYLIGGSQGSANQASITLESIFNFSFNLPSLIEQHAIARILGSLDDKIELNRQMNETLEAMARAIFQSWFVDFDPVRAKDEGRDTGLPPEVAALFPSEFEEVDGRELPKGWRIGTLKEIVDLRGERVEPTPEKNNLRYIALEDIPSKSLDLSNFQQGSAVNSSIIAFCKGDILFGSMRPYFHKVGLTFFDGITRTTTFVLRPKKSALRHFALFHFFSVDIVSFATTASVGTTIPYVKWESLREYQIVIPTEAVLEEFEMTVRPLLEKIRIHGEQSRTLAQIRDALLPKLMSGEIQVENLS